MCLVYMWWTIANAMYAKSASNMDADTGLTIDPSLPNNPNTAAGQAVLAAIFIYYAFYNIAMSPLLVSYTVEILPFRIRSKGLMVMQMCVNASLVFNQYVNPIALDGIGWKLYIVYTVWLGFEFIYLWFTVIETKGPNGPLSLEEIAAIFDGDDKVAQLEARTAAQQAPVQANYGDEKVDGDKKGPAHVESI